jgi:hypothetical protein
MENSNINAYMNVFTATDLNFFRQSQTINVSNAIRYHDLRLASAYDTGK